MPLPIPNAQETQEDFISRCMSDKKTNSEFPDKEQRLGVCNAQYSRRQTQSHSGNIVTKEFRVMMPVVKSWTETIKSEDGEKQARFFKVAVSGLKEDRDGDIMDIQAINGMIDQFKSGVIPLFPDHGNDPVSGMRTYGWKQIMGVWTDAQLDGDRLFAVARLNEAHPDANMLWGFMQEGMPIGFSIGASVVEAVDEKVTEYASATPEETK